MSVQNFIPKIWSARLLANLDKSLVFKNFVNTDYQGEITNFGDSVVINQMGDLTVKDYTGVDIDDPESLTSATQTLLIDKAKYFNFKVDDVDAAQSNVTLIDKGMDRAAVAIGDVIDQAIAGKVVDAGVTKGTLVAPVVITASNAYDELVNLGVSLDTNNVARAGRKIVLPPWYLGLLSKDPRFTLNFSILGNGVVEGATVAGFQLLMSNNVVKDTTDPLIFKVPAGTNAAISFAAQVTKTEAYSPEKSFADAVKGLYVYGLKVIEPKALVNFIVKQGA